MSERASRRQRRVEGFTDGWWRPRIPNHAAIDRLCREAGTYACSVSWNLATTDERANDFANMPHSHQLGSLAAITVAAGVAGAGVAAGTIGLFSGGAALAGAAAVETGIEVAVGAPVFAAAHASGGGTAAALGAFGWTAGRRVLRGMGCLNSFTAATLVATAAGGVAIANIAVGDEVLAYNEATGEIGSYPVTDTINHEDPVLINLTVDPDPMDDQPGEVIVTTPEHPFWVLGEWVDAEDLTVGMPLSRPAKDGGLAVAGTVVDVERVEETRVMFNLTVDEAYTFFVGNEAWLVHNVGGNCPWTSPAGLVYKTGSPQGNRVAHLFEHLADNPAKQTHSVFNVESSAHLLPLIDEAYSKVLRNNIQPEVGDVGTYVIPMGRVIGTDGERSIRLVLRPGTTEVITAYPWKGNSP